MTTYIVLSPTGISSEDLPTDGSTAKGPVSNVGTLLDLLDACEPHTTVILGIWDDDWNDGGGIYSEDDPANVDVTVGQLALRLGGFPPETLIAIRLDGLTCLPGDVHYDEDRRPGDAFQLHTYMDIAVERDDRA